MAEHTNNIINDERKATGLLQRRDDKDVSTMLQNDEQIFKTWIATPREPVTSNRFKIPGSEVMYEEILPKVVSTMALGNLNTREVQLMRLYLEMARRAQRHGYMNVAINLYYKVVFLCVSSQSHMAFLARQLFTENVIVQRKEESYTDSRDSTPQEKGGAAAFIDKLKRADGSTMWGKGGIKGTGVQDSGAYGMRQS